MRKTLALLAAAMLAGCAAPTWHKAGATDREFQMSLARCRMGVAMVPQQQPNPFQPQNQMMQAGAAMENLGAQMAFIDNCLMADGWERRFQ